jgi:hypothetical protein
MDYEKQYIKERGDKKPEKEQHNPHCHPDLEHSNSEYVDWLERFSDWLCKRLEKVEKELEKSNEPYFGWCDVEGCKNEASSGGCYWEETGYWKICSKHAEEHRKGASQPKMRQTAIDRENSRDKVTNYLPINEATNGKG